MSGIFNSLISMKNVDRKDADLDLAVPNDFYIAADNELDALTAHMTDLAPHERDYNKLVIFLSAMEQAPTLDVTDHHFFIEFLSQKFSRMHYDLPKKEEKEFLKKIKDIINYAYSKAILAKFSEPDVLEITLNFIRKMSEKEVFNKLFIEKTGATVSQLPVIEEDKKTGKMVVEYKSGSRKAAEIMKRLTQRLKTALHFHSGLFSKEEKELIKFVIEMCALEKMQRFFVRREFVIMILNCVGYCGSSLSISLGSSGTVALADHFSTTCDQVNEVITMSGNIQHKIAYRKQERAIKVFSEACSDIRSFGSEEDSGYASSMLSGTKVQSQASASSSSRTSSALAFGALRLSPEVTRPIASHGVRITLV